MSGQDRLRAYIGGTCYLPAMSTPRPNDPLAPVTRADLRDELEPIHTVLARLDERVDGIEKRMATAADVEKMGRKLVMWIAGLLVVLVGLFATIVGWLISRLPTG